MHFVVSVSVNGPQVLVNINAIMNLLEFVNSSTSVLKTAALTENDPLPQDGERPLDNQPPEFSVLESVDSSVDQTTVKGGNGGSGGKMLINISIKKPVVALLEHSNSPDPRALGLQVCVCCVCVCVCVYILVYALQCESVVGTLIVGVLHINWERVLS